MKTKKNKITKQQSLLAENKIVDYLKKKADGGKVAILRTKDAKKITGLADYKAAANLILKMRNANVLKRLSLGCYELNNNGIKTTKPKRQQKAYTNILKVADAIVNSRSQESERMYGSFNDGMDKAAAMFNLMTGYSITAVEMFKAMVALKLSRESFNHKEDNLLDAVAYIGALNNYINKNK